MYTLLVETGKNKGKRLKIPAGESIVGRDESAALRIASSEVSRQHCVLIVRPEGLFVRDLGSSNGTFVNGRPIPEETALKTNDLLMIGPMGFRVQGRITPQASEARRAIPSPGTAPQDQGLSDDEIASWLSDGEAPAADDTAVIHPVAEPRQPPITPPKRKAFQSVHDEAEDIIRRHRESRKPKEAE